MLSLPVPFAITAYNAHRRFLAPGWPTWSWADHIRSGTAAASHIYNGFSAVFFTALAALIPLILSVTLYGYMHDRRAVDVYHALPLRRQELFLGSAIAAAIMMWAPLAVAFAATGAIAAAVPGMSAALVFKDLFFWAAAMLAVFAIASFCATQVGAVQDQLLFTLVFSASASVVGLLLNLLAQEHIYGYTVGDSFFNLVYRLCPFSLMIGRHLAVSSPWYHDSNVAAAVWLVLSIALLLLSAELYARRKSEQAEVLGNIGPLQIYVRLIGTLVGGVCVGFLIGSFLDISISRKMILPCIAIGGLIVYPIGDAVLARRVRPPRQILPVGLASVALACMVCAGAIFDVFGYAKRMPDPAQIESVTLNGFSTRYLPQKENGSIVLRDPASVGIVLEAHRMQIAHGDRDGDTYSGKNLHVTYTLKNGRTMQRGYNAVADETLRLLQTLETNDEVLLQTAAVFSLPAERISRITVIDAIDGERTETALTAQQRQSLLAALRDDLLAQPQSDLDAGGAPLAIVRLEAVYRSRDDTPSTMPVPEPTDGGVYYREYDYMVTAAFSRTLRELAQVPEVRSKGIGDGSLGRVETVSLWLNPGDLQWGRSLYYSAGSVDNATDIIYYYRDDTENIPFASLTKEEFAAAQAEPFAYCPNRSDDLRQIVEVFYYDAEPATHDPCGVAFVRLEALPEALQRELVARYEALYGDEGIYGPKPALPVV